MRFEISERIRTHRPDAEIFAALQEQFRKVSSRVTLDNGRIKAGSIEASFGSINRKDETIISIKPLDGGCLLIADVLYKPSMAFWIIFAITLFSWVGWIIPLAFYMLQKKVVAQAIKNCFERIKNEFEHAGPAPRTHENSIAFEIEKLAELKQRGLVTEQEYELRKKALLTDRSDNSGSGHVSRPERSPSTSNANMTSASVSPQESATTSKTSVGNFDHDIPHGVKAWSWGAFFLSFVWAIPNKTWIGLLALVPVIGLPVPFILGVKGREWAWRNKRWESVEQFNQVQRRWSVWGFAFYSVSLAIVVGTVAYPRLAEHFARKETMQDREEVELMSKVRPNEIGPIPASGVVATLLASGKISDQVANVFSEQTRAGLVNVGKDVNGDRRILVNGKALFNGDDAPWQLPLKLFKMSSGQEMILVESAGGRGTSCEALFFFIVVDSNAAVTWTPMFGSCMADGTFNQRTDHVELVIPKMGGQSVYIFDGTTLSEDGRPVGINVPGQEDPSK